ncbi:MAG: ribonuclease HI family protein [Rhodocyclaceae bacterium]|nr:ribonuclease HI family protein [Rhodocyclaceae bacterium]
MNGNKRLLAPLPPVDYWQVWFDGAALPNPGRVGIGMVLISPAGERWERALLPKAWGCSNEAELHALCAAMQWAHEVGARHLWMWSDSRFAVDQIGGAQTTAIVRLRVLMERAREWQLRFEQVQLRWVPRHRNGDADRLSRQALGLPAKPAKRPDSVKRRRR